jgi:uncharacterized protein (TIGR02217 family)
MTTPVFPALKGLAWPVIRTPINSTSREVAVSGKEARFALWSYPRYRYELTFDYLSSDASKSQDWQALEGFWKKVYGPANPFLFTLPDDSAATDQQFWIGDGLTTQVQLVRTMAGFTEPVFAPNIVNVKIDGVPTSSYTLGALGVLTFTAPPATGKVCTWTGTFSWYCRFDDDEVSFRNLYSLFWQLERLSFTTAKLP